MQLKSLLDKTCESTPIHGAAYFVNKKLHIVEKVFWGVIIISASYFSLNICLKQLQRFRDSPLVYSLQLTWNKKDFPYSGITMCSNYYSEKNTAELIQRIWHHEPNTTKFDYYVKFLKIVNLMHYDTMDKLQPYVNDSTLKKIDFLDIMLSMRHGTIPIKNYTENTPTKKCLTEEEEFQIFQRSYRAPDIYAAAITEVGMCQTTSQYSEYTNPYGEIKHLPVTKITFCAIMKECETKFTPEISPEFAIRVYLHDAFDVVSPNDRSTVKRVVKPHDSLTMDLLLGSTTAEDEVRNLPIAYRKCRYPDENNLKYFKTYRPGLCRLECRINAALNLCNCKPYFYVAAPHAPICGIKGMLCLVKKNWTKTDCSKKCFPLCEEYTYTATQNIPLNDNSAKFERTLSIRLILPKMAMQRRVIFSTDQLIVSLGGAIGLFLGSSFMSVCEVIYFICEYFISHVTECLKRKRILKRRTVHFVKPLGMRSVLTINVHK